MTRDWDKHAISDFHLERFALGELSPAIARKLEARLSADPDLRERLEAVQAHERRFQTAFPAARMVARIKAAAAAPAAFSFARGFRDFRLPFVWRAAGAFAILLLAAMPILFPKSPFIADEAADTAADGVRLKGMRPELRLHRNTPSGPERLAPGSAASAGDVIQIEFHPGDYPFGSIISVDGAGGVTLHWPSSPDAGTSLSAFRAYRLPQAFQLDSAPRFERFHLLLSREPIDLKGALKLAAASAGESEDWLASRLPKSVRTVNFTLTK